MPVLGVNARAKRILASILAGRTREEHMRVWSQQGVPYDRLQVVSSIIQQWLHWPNDLFIPEDPCAIVFWHPGFSLDSVGLMLELVEKHDVPLTLVDDLSNLNYGEFIIRAFKTALSPKT
jgi:hypothetical protein